MGNFGGLTAFYVRLLASRCMPAEPAPTSGVTATDPPGCEDCNCAACELRRKHEAASGVTACPVSPEVAALLRIWQSHLGETRDQCDEPGRKLWDRIEVALGVKVRPAYLSPEACAEVAEHMVEQRNAGVTATVPAWACPECYGSTTPGFKRGLRCKTCDGTATRNAGVMVSDDAQRLDWIEAFIRKHDRMPEFHPDWPNLRAAIDAARGVAASSTPSAGEPSQ